MPFGVRDASRVARRAAVPTGTVDFPTTKQSLVTLAASSSITDSIWLRSALSESASCGVPTQMK